MDAEVSLYVGQEYRNALAFAGTSVSWLMPRLHGCSVEEPWEFRRGGCPQTMLFPHLRTGTVAGQWREKPGRAREFGAGPDATIWYSRIQRRLLQTVVEGCLRKLQGRQGLEYPRKDPCMLKGWTITNIPGMQPMQTEYQNSGLSSSNVCM